MLSRDLFRRTMIGLSVCLVVSGVSRPSQSTRAQAPVLAEIAPQAEPDGTSDSRGAGLPSERTRGRFETMALFQGPMPTGVTVSDDGRVFVCIPRSMDDRTPITVAEVRDGRTSAYPDAAINRLNRGRAGETFVSIQSVVIDPKNRLWALDVGRVGMDPVIPEGAKLVGIDLTTNQVFKTIVFPPEVALPTSSVNDVRFDLRRGSDGVAFITDASDTGPNAIIVVDLATGESARRLHDHPSTKAEPQFLPFVEGRELRLRLPGQSPKFISTGADGIAISSDGASLYYSPLASRRLFSVSTDALLDRNASDAYVADTVRDLGPKPAADGLESDAEGRLYSTAYEQHAVMRRSADGTYQTLLFDPRVLWPDTLSLASDGYLYLLNNQLHRQPRYHNGMDRRERPYSLLRVRVDATPVRLQ
jgi:sugar lactone lactonase YvrE